MKQAARLADFGLVGSVGGGVAMLVIGMLTIAVSAFLGRVPLVLAALMILATAVTVVSVTLLLIGRNRAADKAG